MKIAQIKTASPFEDFYPINKLTLDHIISDMQENGYDQTEPVIIWKEKKILVDGHTRLAGAEEVGIDDIPIVEISFKSEIEALEYAAKKNSNRRHNINAWRFRAFRILDEKNPQGGDHKKQNANLRFEKSSSERTAKLIGVGTRTVEKMRTILDYGTDEDIEDVENNEMSIDAAYKSAQEEKERIEEEKKRAKLFNRTTDSIEWALWTWNPVTGCEHGCKYCYARDIADRFYEQGFEPTFHDMRLDAPKNNKIPKVDEVGEHNVFVCSMADLFGKWVPDEWIEKVFESIKESPDWWNYLLLTKYPDRYLKLDIPDNCWVGATATNQKEMDKTVTAFQKLRKKVDNYLFISCEPLMGKIEADLSCIDWLIIGGRSRSKGMDAGQPKWEWVEDLIWQAREHDVQVYFKPNLTVVPKEYPKI
jgi:protein gp37